MLVVLSAVFVSNTPEATVAVLVIVPPLPGTVTITTMFGADPSARLLVVQVATPPA